MRSEVKIGKRTSGWGWRTQLSGSLAVVHRRASLQARKNCQSLGLAVGNLEVIGHGMFEVTLD
jgi:hypothetical protein